MPFWYGDYNETMRRIYRVSFETAGKSWVTMEIVFNAVHGYFAAAASSDKYERLHWDCGKVLELIEAGNRNKRQ